MNRSQFKIKSRLLPVGWMLGVLCVSALQGCGGSSTAPNAAAEESVSIVTAERMTSPVMSMANVDNAINESSLPLAQAKGFSGLSMNLHAFEYWSTDFPIIDQFKRAGGWVTSTNDTWDTGEQSQLKLDANGWVTSLPAPDDKNVKYRFVRTNLFQDDGGAHPSGDYTVLYDGEGTLSYNMPKKLSETRPDGTHRDIITVDAGTLLLTLSSVNPSNHLRNIRILPPGGVCSANKLQVVDKAADCVGQGNYIDFETLSKTQTWYPQFLADLKGMRTIRFMDWGRTNQSKLANWADRPKKTDAFWTGPYGVPMNAMISLSNALNADAWINWPVQVTDDYAKSAAKQLKNQLKSMNNIILEYSNEPWNTAPAFLPNFNWQLAKAEALWGSTGGPNTNWDEKMQWVANWNAMRAVQLCDIVRTEFGPDASRVKCVINGQASNTWYLKNDALPCPKAAGILGKSCASSIDAVAIAPYFAGYFTETNEHQNYIKDNWFTDSDGGLNKLFEEILAKDAQGRTVTPPMAAAGISNAGQKNGALAEARQWMINYRNDVANGPYHKPIYTYEGGQHIINTPRQCANDDTACQAQGQAFSKQWTQLFIQANHDPRMKQAYSAMMDDWKASGGQVFSAFDFVSTYSKDGAWGLRESVNSRLEDSPKWQAMIPYRDSIGCWWGTVPGQCQ